MYEVEWRRVSNRKPRFFELRTVFLALVFCGLCMPAHGSDSSRPRTSAVRIYFLGWEVDTRTRQGMDDVVRNHKVYIEILDRGLSEIFIRWLHRDRMQPRSTNEPGDARLVIEIVAGDGSVDVLYADRNYLYSADSTKARRIGADFRRRFDFASPTN